jgi:hypothetical protein
MANDRTRKIETTELHDKMHVIVAGTLVFSRTHKQIEGKELADYYAGKKTKYPGDKPLTHATVRDCRIIVADPDKPTIEEQYIAQHLFKSKAKNAGNGWSFSAINKTKNLPAISIEEDDKTFTEVPNEAELASGQEVKLDIRIYSYGDRGEHGINLDQIIICKPPVKWYTGETRVDDGLQRYGITFKPLPRDNANEANENIAPPISAAEENTQTGNPYATDGEEENPYADVSGGAGITFGARNY